MEAFGEISEKPAALLEARKELRPLQAPGAVEVLGGLEGPVEVPGGPWRPLETLQARQASGGPWRPRPLKAPEALEAFGGSWRSPPWRCWRPLEAPGGPWRPLETPGGPPEAGLKNLINSRNGNYVGAPFSI